MHSSRGQEIGNIARESAGRIALGLAAVLGLVAVVPPAAGNTAKSTITEHMLSSISMLDPNLTDQGPPEIFQRPAMLAKGLNSPDGIARDPVSGDFFVSDEETATIFRIKPNGNKEVFCSGSTPIYEGTGKTRKKGAGLRPIEGLALDAKNGTLYVVEDVPGGRLISFQLKTKPGSPPFGGEIVPLPVEDSQFAWESIDVGPAGELLLAGSTLDSLAGKDGKTDLFRGAVLYRDVHGDWWMPLAHAMASYSAACFSPDGNYAFFASEVPGSVGCLDLRTHFLRTFLSGKTFHSPEGLCALPEGAVLVAEESGKIYWLDPTTDKIQLLYDHGATIESVFWDRQQRRLLVTDDQNGNVAALELKPGLAFRSAFGTIKDIRFEEESTPVDMIPEKCPAYLAEVLKLGGYDAERQSEKLSFQAFARRYCLVAVDAETRLFPKHRYVEDPIKRIQFVIVAPYLIGYQEGELIWSSSGFTVVKESGQTLKTELVKRQVVHGDLMECRFTPVGGQNIALPLPFSARISSDGHVAVNFLGMGVMADFYLMLDPNEPNESVMVVVQPDGFVQQYQVQLPPRKNKSHWVVALERKGPDSWKSLSRVEKSGD